MRYVCNTRSDRATNNEGMNSNGIDDYFRYGRKDCYTHNEPILLQPPYIRLYFKFDFYLQEEQ